MNEREMLKQVTERYKQLAANNERVYKDPLLAKFLKPCELDIEQGDSYEGFIEPWIRWNGWMCPYFDDEVASQLLDDLAEAGCRVQRDFPANLVRIWLDPRDAEPEEFEAVETDLGRLWPIGYGSWCWQLVEDGLEEYDD